MRDYETIETALTAAETGHLVALYFAHTRRHRKLLRRIVPHSLHINKSRCGYNSREYLRQ